MYSKDNRLCVTVDRSAEGSHYMTIYKPEHVTVILYKDGSLLIQVNEMGVFRLDSPKTLNIVQD